MFMWMSSRSGSNWNVPRLDFARRSCRRPGRDLLLLLRRQQGRPPAGPWNGRSTLRYRAHRAASRTRPTRYSGAKAPRCLAGIGLSTWEGIYGGPAAYLQTQDTSPPRISRQFVTAWPARWAPTRAAGAFLRPARKARGGNWVGMRAWRTEFALPGGWPRQRAAEIGILPLPFPVFRVPEEPRPPG